MKPYSLKLTSNYLIIAGLLLIDFSLPAPPAGLDIISIVGNIHQHFILTSIKDPTNIVTPAVQKRQIFKLDGNNPPSESTPTTSRPQSPSTSGFDNRILGGTGGTMNGNSNGHSDHLVNVDRVPSRSSSSINLPVRSRSKGGDRPLLARLDGESFAVRHLIRIPTDDWVGCILQNEICIIHNRKHYRFELPPMQPQIPPSESRIM